MTAGKMRQHPSPNHGPRKDGLSPHLIVLHYTAMASAEAALARLCDPTVEVSAHYLIALNGEVTQMVAETRRAWHAGAGEWHGQSDINSRSIGVELDNRGDHPFPEPQMHALENLLRDMMARWQIPPAGVIGHSDMAPGRKSDPGPHFDWARLARCGLASAVLPETNASADMMEFMARAKAAGYTANVDADTLLEATRLRCAPWRKGPLVPKDLALP